MAPLAATPRNVALILGQPVPGFIERFGHVQYGRVMTRPQHWRIGVMVASACEVDSRHKTDFLVFDHCHDHGWVRALVCNSCNVRLGQIEAVRRLDGVQVDLGESGFGVVLARCPGAVSTLPGKGPFAGKPVKPKPVTNRLLIINPQGLAMNRRSSRAHIRTADRTACGLVADGMTLAAPDAPVCCSCSRRVEPVALEQLIAAR